MTNYEIRVGARPDDHGSRTIGISPQLPQEIVDVIHSQFNGRGQLPYLRVGRCQPPAGEPYSAATVSLRSFPHETRANRHAFEIIGALAGVIRGASQESTITIDHSRIYSEHGLEAWLFGEAAAAGVSPITAAGPGK